MLILENESKSMYISHLRKAENKGKLYRWMGRGLEYHFLVLIFILYE